jgi:natural product precursor
MKQVKKLTLKREKISDMNDPEMKNLKGGIHSLGDSDPTVSRCTGGSYCVNCTNSNYCPPTYPGCGSC